MQKNYLFPPESPASLAIEGSTVRVPLRRVYCVGRNYADHAREMGANPEREALFFFCKSGDAVSVLAVDGSSYNAEGLTPLPYPPMTNDLQHEVELVVVLGRMAQALSPETAWDAVLGLAVGLDMTRRDLQTAAKKKDHPWEAGKAFDFSAPIGPMTLLTHYAGGAEAARQAIKEASITLQVNGVQRQNGQIADMIWSVPEIIAQLSQLVTLMPGDVIMTGTPAGVGPVTRGDTLLAQVQGLHPIHLQVV